MAIDPSISAARKRVDRFLFADPDRTDQILALSSRQQNELIDLAWSGDGKAARTRLAEYTRERHATRSAASAKAAATRHRARARAAANKVIAHYQARNKENLSPARIYRNSSHWTLQQIKDIEKSQGGYLDIYLSTKARRPPLRSANNINPFWYH